MPNWCFNTMSIRGPQDQIDEVLAKIKAGASNDATGNFACLTSKKYDEFNDNTFVFSLEVTAEDEGEIAMTFETRWSPLGDEVLELASKAYPDLVFSQNYEEGGERFMGYDSIQNGVWIKRQYFQRDQYIDSQDAVEQAREMPLEDIPGCLSDFDPEADEAEYRCPTAFAILKARLEGKEITEENFPQLYLEEA